ncbi:hypothetical protein [Victivallis sp. Marseille-Q1083]|nr:hypothetical protein [Victivallis sp. Marseille-Q1083]
MKKAVTIRTSAAAYLTYVASSGGPPESGEQYTIKSRARMRSARNMTVPY